MIHTCKTCGVQATDETLRELFYLTPYDTPRKDCIECYKKARAPKRMCNTCGKKEAEPKRHNCRSCRAKKSARRETRRVNGVLAWQDEIEGLKMAAFIQQIWPGQTMGRG